MNRTTITPTAWTSIPTSLDGDYLIQFMDGGMWATGAGPTSPIYGFTAQPFEKIVVPAGVAVFARASGNAASTVVSGVFGV